jgi:hypothetical protein
MTFWGNTTLFRLSWSLLDLNLYAFQSLFRTLGVGGYEALHFYHFIVKFF